MNTTIYYFPINWSFIEALSFLVARNIKNVKAIRNGYILFTYIEVEN